MSANKVGNLEIIISDYWTSLMIAQTSSPTLHTPSLYSPPEDPFNETITQLFPADVWTLGVNLNEALGERPIFEIFSWDRDDIIGEMVNTLGHPPVKLWNFWANRSELFEENGSWIAGFRRISDPILRRLHQHLWQMGRGETEQTCEWDVKGGELSALEDLIRAMMAFDSTERPTVDQLLKSKFIVKWALPAWEKQRSKGEGSDHPTDEKY